MKLYVKRPKEPPEDKETANSEHEKEKNQRHGRSENTSNVDTPQQNQSQEKEAERPTANSASKAENSENEVAKKSQDAERYNDKNENENYGTRGEEREKDNIDVKESENNEGDSANENPANEKNDRSGNNEAGPEKSAAEVETPDGRDNGSESEDSGGENEKINNIESTGAVEDSGEEAQDGEETQDEDGESEGEEDGGQQQQSHVYNTDQAVDVLERPPVLSLKYVQTEFYRFIEMIAETPLKIIDFNTEPDSWNFRKLMLRQYERKPLSAYRCSHIRDAVVLILDNSGSMQWWAENLRLLAVLALQRGDVEIYVAPNGHIEAFIDRRGYLREVDHAEVMKSLQGRRIIYVGDYDGGNTPVELSWRNDVIWVAPEQRYRWFRSHDWMQYDESQFRGVFIRAYNLEEMFQAFKRVTRFYNLWIDLHEDDEYEDD